MLRSDETVRLEIVMLSPIRVKELNTPWICKTEAVRVRVAGHSYRTSMVEIIVAAF